MAATTLPRRSKPLRHPAVGLAAATLLGLLAAFFGWQGAEPLWLALGRGDPGTATVTRCDPSTGAPVDTARPVERGLTYRCVTFEADRGGFQALDVTLRGAGDAAREEGARVPARMLSPDAGRAYAADAAGLHLRWGVGLLLVLACGAGIAWASGATRLDRHRPRRIAVLLSFGGPLLLAAGFLAASW